MLNNRGYLNKWGSPVRIGSTEKYLDFDDRYAFSNIAMQQIGNSASAKAAIRAAIDNNQPVVFRMGFWDGAWLSSTESVLHKFWHTYDNSQNYAIFDGINAGGSTIGDSGHVMCIVGYDDSDYSFIVQNSWGTCGGWWPNGTFKIPQDLDYDKQHYKVSPLSLFGWEYRFEFYKLIPTWITNDTEPPTIPDFASVDYILAAFPYCNVSVAINDNVKVTDDVSATLTVPGYGIAPISGKMQHGTWVGTLPADMGTMTPPITGTLAITAYDSSGNSASGTCTVHFAQGLPISLFAER
jgi:hypothetical protein